MIDSVFNSQDLQFMLLADTQVRWPEFWDQLSMFLVTLCRQQVLKFLFTVLLNLCKINLKSEVYGFHGR